MYSAKPALISGHQMNRLNTYIFLVATTKKTALRLLKEAPTRFELVIEVLQTFALPLGYGAIFIFL